MNNMKLLASGSYSDVFHYLQNGTTYVVKRCNKYLYSTFELNNFYKEIVILNSLNHENIVTYKRWTENEKFIDIIMLFGGMSLETQIRTINENDAKIIIMNVLLGLEYLHKNKVIHCDLNPRNILIKNIRKNEIFICDFGLSIVNEENYIFPINNMIGNKNFLSPEILMQNKLSYATDLWSLGIIVYYVITNNYPFHMVNCDNIKQKIDEFKSLKYNNNKFSEKSYDFINKLLVFNPEDRMTTTEALNHEWLVDNKILN